ncbi:hypothetical protein CSUI_005038, partial [Cystoisospora suis]
GVFRHFPSIGVSLDISRLGTCRSARSIESFRGCLGLCGFAVFLLTSTLLGEMGEWELQPGRNAVCRCASLDACC